MATISKKCSGDPEIGQRHENGKWRAVIGWNHNTDTTEGLKEGRVWCWVSEPPEKLQVYDQSFNRSPTAGEVRFCGVANFTMVRMFHPYWTRFGMVPRDGDWRDKSRCRSKYHMLIRNHRLAMDLPVDSDIEEPAGHTMSLDLVGKNNKKKKAKKTSQAGPQSEQAVAQETAYFSEEESVKDVIPGTLEVLPGGYAQDAILID